MALITSGSCARSCALRAGTSHHVQRTRTRLPHMWTITHMHTRTQIWTVLNHNGPDQLGFWRQIAIIVMIGTATIDVFFLIISGCECPNMDCPSLRSKYRLPSTTMALITPECAAPSPRVEVAAPPACTVNHRVVPETLKRDCGCQCAAVASCFLFLCLTPC